MNDDDDFDQGFPEDETSTASPAGNIEPCASARRRLEERLEESRVSKQTRDYDFDLD